MKIRKGETFGRLTVIQESSAALVACKCSCGAARTVRAHDLRSGRTKSCGCLGREKRIAASSQHGHARVGKITTEYRSWTMMKNRCLNSSDKSFKHYGGRGIKVCAPWLEFGTFLSDMGAKPSSKHSIERINNDGDYEPSNCRWATRMEQARNTRRNLFVEHAGQRKTVAEWSRESGIALRTLYDRLHKGLDFLAKENLCATIHKRPIGAAQPLPPEKR